jgi:hypothetical protein
MTSDFGEIRGLRNAKDQENLTKPQTMAEFRCNSEMTVQVVLLPRGYVARRQRAGVTPERFAGLPPQQCKGRSGSLSRYGSAIHGFAGKPSGIVAIKPQIG